MSAVSYHAQAAYDMQCGLYRRWVRGERGPRIPPFDELTVPFPADRVRIEADERRAVWCLVCWGSHGCDLPPGHDGAHRCMVEPDELDDEPGGPCSEFEGSRARFWLDPPGGWSEWSDGWTAIPGTDR